MSNISKSDYIECLARMIDMTNEELKKYPVDSFISQDHEGVVCYYRVKSVRPGVCTVSRSFFSITIETLIPPSMIVEPIAQSYYREWRNMKGKPLKDIIHFYEGGKDNRRGGAWSMPNIAPFFSWEPAARYETGIGKIVNSPCIGRIYPVDNVAIIEVLNKVKLYEERRNRENERIKQEQLEREKQSRSITKSMIDDLLKSI